MRRLLSSLLLLFVAGGASAEMGYEKLVKSSLPKVVLIEVHGFVDDFESDDSTITVKREVSWLGSGALINADGYVLTCDHLFMRKLEDRRIIVKMADGKKYNGMLLAEDHKKDLGLVKIFSLHPLPYFEIGKSIERGQVVLAFGAPLGITKTVSVGYVENLVIGPDKRTLHGAAINPGNSGGPLVNSDGKLVGVNVAHLMVNIFMRAESMGLAVNLKDILGFLK